MTIDEAIEKLNSLTDDDPEVAHVTADKILCDFLRAHGFGAVADVFDAADTRVGFWYA